MPLTTEHLAAPLNYWPSTGCISLGTIGAEGETSSKPTFLCFIQSRLVEWSQCEGGIDG
jgi:hypothetical protein